MECVAACKYGPPPLLDHFPTQSSDVQPRPEIHSLETPPSEYLSRVQALLSCPTKITVARSFQGDEAQRLIDFLDQVSRFCLPCFENLGFCTQVLTRSLLKDKLLQRCLRLLSKICEAHRIVPSSYILQEGLIHIRRVWRHGGSADVWDGEYLGCPVAVKRLKVNEFNPDSVFKVSLFNQSRVSPTLNPYPGFMSRNHMLETFVSSQHFAFVRGFCVYRPSLFLHYLGLDAQRERDAIYKVQP